MTLTLFATYIVQTTFAVTLLIGAVLLVRRPFATAFGAKAAYALWAIPFLRLIMPPMPANWTLFGLLTRPDTATPETVIPIHCSGNQQGLRQVPPIKRSRYPTRFRQYLRPRKMPSTFQYP
jgi:hypothetical protein